MTNHERFSKIPTRVFEGAGFSRRPEVELSRRIFANRDLELSKVEMIGFDMDYTLAVYNKEPMERLQYDLTLQRMIENLGYPKAIGALNYDPDFVLRGLTIDKRNGNIFKSDAYNHVTRAYHGRAALSAEQIQEEYHDTVVKITSDDFASLDTLFALPEASLFTNLVDYFSQRLAEDKSVEPVQLPLHHETENRTRINTWKIAHDVRTAIDSIHKDGSLKGIIVADLPTYILPDEGLALALHKLRSAGKKLFLLTNSHWPYTQSVMSYLLDNRLEAYPDWRRYFDYVLVAGRKPAFFTERQPFDELVVDGRDFKSQTFDTLELRREHVYHKGNIKDFERLTGYSAGQILYVGDHIFGDIMRSRKDSRWRTCLVVEELERELGLFVKHREEIHELALVDEKRHVLDREIAERRSQIDQLELLLEEGAQPKVGVEILKDALAPAEEIAELLKTYNKEVDQAKRELRQLDEESRKLQDTLEDYFSPTWGMLFRENNELSRFGAEVRQYACVYTSRVSNMLQYSPMHFFRAPRELMSHDYAVADSRGLSNVLRIEEL